MGYMISQVKAGAVIEIEKWKRCSRERRRELKRSGKVNPTREAQQKVNDERAFKKCRLLVNENFRVGDYWLTFTFASEFKPSFDLLTEEYPKMIRKLRTLYRRVDVEFKYISPAIDYGRRPHLHMLLPQGVALSDIHEAWPFGRIHIKLLDESGSYYKLAEYIFNHGGEDYRGKRWNQSKNLKTPVEKVREVKANAWREEPAAPKGYMIDKTYPIKRGVNPINGDEYLKYAVVALPTEKKGNSRGGQARVCAGVTSNALKKGDGK